MLKVLNEQLFLKLFLKMHRRIISTISASLRWKRQLVFLTVVCSSLINECNVTENIKDHRAWQITSLFTWHKTEINRIASMKFITTTKGGRKLLREKAVAQTCSVKKVFLEISQNSQENTCSRVSFTIIFRGFLIFHFIHWWLLL